MEDYSQHEQRKKKSEKPEAHEPEMRPMNQFIPNDSTAQTRRHR